jgi:hypothetical protein
MNQPDASAADLAGIDIPEKNKHGMTAVRSRGEGDVDIYPFSLDRDEIARLYVRSMKQVQFNFAPVTCGSEKLAFSPEEQHRVRRKVALHWMYFYALNDLPVLVKHGDLSHPQTYSIIRRIAGQRFGYDTPQAIAVTAGAVGMSVADFRGWMERDKQLGDAF